MVVLEVCRESGCGSCVAVLFGKERRPTADTTHPQGPSGGVGASGCRLSAGAWTRQAWQQGPSGGVSATADVSRVRPWVEPLTRHAQTVPCLLLLHEALVLGSRAVNFLI